MENASKALIIAGAILLSILIISLGIMVYNSAKNAANGGNIDKAQLQAFNSEWEGYVGENRTASEVRALYQAVIANNAAEDKAETNRKIKISLNNAAAAEPTKVGTLSNSTTYKIDVVYTNGLVTQVNVTTKSTTNTTPNTTP